MQIIEIIAIESSKNEHVAPYETGTVPSPGLGDISRRHLQSGHCVFGNVSREHVVEITAEPPPENVDLSIMHCRRMSPSGQERGTVQLPFPPRQFVDALPFEEVS